VKARETSSVGAGFRSGFGTCEEGGAGRVDRWCCGWWCGFFCRRRFYGSRRLSGGLSGFGVVSCVSSLSSLRAISTYYPTRRRRTYLFTLVQRALIFFRFRDTRCMCPRNLSAHIRCHVQRDVLVISSMECRRAIYETLTLVSRELRMRAERRTNTRKSRPTPVPVFIKLGLLDGIAASVALEGDHGV
jgi:hypothetical protein